MRTLFLAVAAVAALHCHARSALAQPCPVAPTNLFTSSTACQGRIDWDYATDPLDFQILRGIGPMVNTATHVTSVPGTQRYVTIPIDGDPTAYNYFVRARIAPTAECPTGIGAAGVVLFFPELPSAPAWVHVVESCTGATITWEEVPLAQEYVVRLVRDPDEAAIFETTVAHPPLVWINPGGLLPWTVEIYSYGTCGLNTQPASMMLLLEPTPFAPSDVAATDHLTCRVDVTWTPNPWHVGGYRVYRDDVLLATINEPADSYSDSTAAADQVYTYQVVAFTSCGDAPDVASDTGIAPSSAAQVSTLAQRVLSGQTATLAVPDALTGDGVVYAWRRGVSGSGAGGTPVTNGDRYSGADSPTLSIAGARPTDTDFYALDVFSADLPCGVATTVVPLVVPTTCAADFDGSGTLGVPDIFAFLAAWFAGCP